MDDFDRCWPLIEPALQVAGNTHSKEELATAIRRGDAHFWHSANAAIITEFFATPRTKTINFWLVGGDLRELLRMAPLVESWAKTQGCTHAMGAGRSTWGRVLKRHGYQPMHVTFEKEL